MAFTGEYNQDGSKQLECDVINPHYVRNTWILFVLTFITGSIGFSNLALKNSIWIIIPILIAYTILMWNCSNNIQTIRKNKMIITANRMDLIICIWNISLFAYLYNYHYNRCGKRSYFLLTCIVIYLVAYALNLYLIPNKRKFWKKALDRQERKE